MGRMFQKPRSDEVDRVLRGALWGLIASGIMTVVMVIDFLFTHTPGPRTFPILILGRWLRWNNGAGLYLTALVAHLAYGSLMGMLFAFLARPMTFAKGIGFAMLLWIILQIEFLPQLGWGDFAWRHGGGSMPYTLTLHLIYGMTIGFLGARDESRHTAHFDDLGRLAA